jgi:hypothetical protein
MRKNSKVHFWIETELKLMLEKKAKSEGLSVSEYCRNILREDFKFREIKIMLEKIQSALENRKIYKEVHINNSNIGHNQ